MELFDKSVTSERLVGTMAVEDALKLVKKCADFHIEVPKGANPRHINESGHRTTYFFRRSSQKRDALFLLDVETGKFDGTIVFTDLVGGGGGGGL